MLHCQNMFGKNLKSLYRSLCALILLWPVCLNDYSFTHLETFQFLSFLFVWIDQNSRHFLLLSLFFIWRPNLVVAFQDRLLSCVTTKGGHVFFRDLFVTAWAVRIITQHYHSNSIQIAISLSLLGGRLAPALTYGEMIAIAIGAAIALILFFLNCMLLKENRRKAARNRALAWRAKWLPSAVIVINVLKP